MIRPGGGRRCIDWDAFFARPGSREMTAPEIGRALGVKADNVREAALRRGIRLPHGKPGTVLPPPWKPQLDAAKAERIRQMADDAATLAELAALQAVPRYDARVA
ncbi:MAG TPA: hypothetical protein VNS22_27640 [Geminicoccus sp.]|uniref:hypothetical protein n=1 Tax=Geminicoccus sp. TaxID=2024832 RepID=UPI002C3F65DB|nr:hypothetical protein [Geminicoccus sp.]HWL72133.1 hypothetical protein [Geminicoccus sp.]